MIGPLVLAFDAIVGFVSLTGSFTERLEVPRTTASRGISGSDAEASTVGLEEYAELLADYFPVIAFAQSKVGLLHPA